MRRCSALGGNSNANPGHIARLAVPDTQISSSHFTTEKKLAQECWPESRSTRASLRMTCRNEMPNNAFERTVDHRGRTVLAMDCVLAGAEMQPGAAAQLDR